MDTNSDEDAPPQPGDLSGWRAAIADGSFRQFRPEDIVATIQNLGPNTDKTVLNALAKHLSDTMMRLLRARVGRNHRNGGLDIIEQVHAKLWDAILKPKSADGEGLRAAFYARLNFRLKDAIAAEERGHWAGEDQASETLPDPRGAESLGTFEPADSTQAQMLDEKLDVDTALEAITDSRKRLAFRLFMDGLPFKSTRSRSIADALGISEKTARVWIAEAQELLKQTMGDRT
jgi:RNA polymerase sigma factor (sigma-70 family)